ncbi:MAG: lipoyl(octanoyl) transferase LipB [Alphaproteobacteria bacterium]|nr:lipoyl(octanoyl) transferase LipB [Alphaproteobacteria bacterium]
MTISASQKSPLPPKPARPDHIRPGPDGIMIWENEAPLDYDDAVAAMEAHVTAMQAGKAPEVLWFLQHHPVYTGGSSAKDAELLLPLQDINAPAAHLPTDKPPIIRATGRGGQWTYHAPGQRIVYIMLDLNRRGRDIRAFVHGIEAWGIAACAALGMTATRRHGAPGIWINNNHDKIAAIGVRLSRWISWHGIAINVSAAMLDGFQHIIPCGINGAGVAALEQCIGQPPDHLMARLDQVLMAEFANTLGRYMDSDIANSAP